MKTGYSIILRALEPADRLTPNEVGDLIVVCPECREPVFKVERGMEGGEVHYLSHYNRSQAQVEECELRTARIGGVEIRESASAGRADNMAYLLSCFRALLEDAVARSGVEITEGRLQAIMRSREMQRIKWRIRERRRLDMEGTRKQIATFGNIVLEPGEQPLMVECPRRFEKSRQISIALDMVETLLTDQSRGLYARLFATAWELAIAWSEMERARPEGAPSRTVGFKAMIKPDVADAMRRLPNLKGAKAAAMHADLGDEAGRGGGGLFGLAMAVDTAMHDLLLTMDYLGWLHRRSGFANTTSKHA